MFIDIEFMWLHHRDHVHMNSLTLDVIVEPILCFIWSIIDCIDGEMLEIGFNALHEFHDME